MVEGSAVRHIAVFFHIYQTIQWPLMLRMEASPFVMFLCSFIEVFPFYQIYLILLIHQGVQLIIVMQNAITLLEKQSLQ